MWPSARIASSSAGPARSKRRRHLAALALGLDRRVERAEEAGTAGALAAEADAVADRQALGRPREGLPAVRRDALVQHRLDRRAGPAVAMAQAVEPRGHDPRVVEDQRVARAQQIRQVADVAVGEGAHAEPTTSRRAASRGSTGRSAIRSSGRSKSKSDSFMARGRASSENADHHDAGDHQGDADEAAGRRLAHGHAEHAEFVEEHGGDELAGDRPST